MFCSRCHHHLLKSKTFLLKSFTVIVITTIAFNKVLTPVFRASDSEEGHEMKSQQFLQFASGYTNKHLPLNFCCVDKERAIKVVLPDSTLINASRDETTSDKNELVQNKLDDLLHSVGNSSHLDNTLKRPALRNLSNNHDTERRLRFIHKMMTPYLASLNRSRERYQVRSFPNQHEVCTVDFITKVASATCPDYFDLFQMYFNKSTTLILETPLDIFGEGLLKDYFHPSSNNCSLMHSNTKNGAISGLWM